MILANSRQEEIMTTRTAMVAIVLLIGATLCISFMLYPALPELMLVHRDIHGNVNGWAGKPFAVMFLPALNLPFLFFVLAGEWLWLSKKLEKEPEK
jgi:uncharacterized membrane protein